MEIRRDSPTFQFGRSGKERSLRPGRDFCISYGGPASGLGRPAKELSQELCATEAHEGRKRRPAVQRGTLRGVNRKFLPAFAGHTPASPTASAATRVVPKSRETTRRKTPNPSAFKGFRTDNHNSIAQPQDNLVRQLRSPCT